VFTRFDVKITHAYSQKLFCEVISTAATQGFDRIVLEESIASKCTLREEVVMVVVH
jgi:hypothetical protein